MKRSRVFILFLIIILNISIFYLYYMYEVDQKAKEVSKNQNNFYLAAKNSLYQMSKIIFNLEINKEQYTKILYDATKEPEKREYYHNLLYQKILPLYTSLQNISLRQLHFHLPGAISFLRMHRPDKYGDSLIGIRKGVELAQREKRAFFGFEEGRVFNGFRNIYPLFYKKNFVGTVEISFNAKAITNFLNNLPYKPYFTGLLVKEKIIHQKVWSNEQKNYLPSIIVGYKWDKITLLHKDFFKIQKILSSIKTPPKNLKTFFTKNFSITFIPIKNFDNEIVAHFVSIYHDTFLSTFQKKITLFTLISTLILTLFTILFFKHEDKKEAYEQFLREQSYLDPLTKIYNRRGLYMRLRPLLDKLKKEQQSYCILFLDIDHFKRLNDTYGHEIGDKVLEVLAKILQENLRQEDIIARWGGEEFIVVLPYVNLHTSMNIASKLLNIIRSYKQEGVPKFTVSIGIACSENGTEFKEILEKADQYLYKAKECGRDQIQSPTLCIEGD